MLFCVFCKSVNGKYRNFKSNIYLIQYLIQLALELDIDNLKLPPAGEDDQIWKNLCNLIYFYISSYSTEKYQIVM